jgi:ABC-type Fe3+/spermidine/putrescine transport system ATPase subunit
VALARTLALRPDVILFDEPMSLLDVDYRLALRIELKELQRKFGSTMVYITTTGGSLLHVRPDHGDGRGRGAADRRNAE